jgi:hypothetical protein
MTDNPIKVLKIGITGDIIFENARKIKETLFQLKKSLKDQEFIVYSLGNKYGADKYIKKYCLELNITYKEYTPLFLPATLYSVYPPEMHNQRWHPALADRHIRNFLKACKKFIVFVNKNEISEKFNLKLINAQTTKLKVPAVFINEF